MSDPPQLFDDTSSSPRSRSEEYPSQGMPEPDSQSFLADPMSKLAMTYGSSLAIQGKEMMDQNIDRFIPVSKLKYYFAVDTVYVGKKLGLLVFPYKHPDWEVRYQQDTPVAPRFDVNAPDLYIPAMAFITYILLAGLALGTQDRFSPEMLGVLASSAFVCLIIEVFIILLALYLVSVNTDLTLVDLFAFSGYKYVGMIVGVLSGLLFGRTGYYLMLSWCCVAIIVFMINLAELHQSLEDSTTRVCKELTSGGRAGAYIHSAEHAIYPHPRLIASDRRPTSTSCTSLRPQKKGSRKNLQLSDGTSVITWFKIRTLRLKILAQAAAEGVVVRGARNQLRMYLTMAIAAAQPVFMFWLTSHLVR